MNAQTKNLLAQVIELAPEDRIELVEEVLSSLEPDQAELDRLWVVEIEDRLAAYKRGEMTARDARDVLAELQRK